MLSLKLGSLHPTRPYILPTEWLFGLPLFPYGQSPLPLTTHLCLVLNSLAMLPDAINFLSTFSLTPQQSITAPGKPIGLSPPILTTPNGYFPSLYCFLSHFFHWKCLTLLSFCFLRLGSKVTCFETVTNSSPILSVTYLSPPSSMQRVILPYICLCVAL